MNHKEELDYQDEYENRVKVFRIRIPHWMKGIPLNVKFESTLFKGTRKEFDAQYDKWIKGHEDEECIKPVEVLYTERSQIDKCDGCVDRNINYHPSKQQKERSQRNEAYRYLGSKFR